MEKNDLENLDVEIHTIFKIHDPYNSLYPNAKATLKTLPKEKAKTFLQEIFYAMYLNKELALIEDSKEISVSIKLKSNGSKN